MTSQQQAFTALLSIAAAAVLAANSAADTLNVPDDYPTIQAGINAAVDGDEVVVAPGTYNEAIDFLYKAITVRSLGGADITTLSAAGLGTSAIIGAASGAVLDGFTVTGGVGTLLEGGQRVGGGMYIPNGSPNVQNCVFTGNSASDSGPNVRFGGGAIYILSGNPNISSCVFNANEADVAGGAIHIYAGGSPTIKDCQFTNNTSGEGGALVVYESSASVTGCTFVGNSTSGAAGAIWVYDSSPSIDSCTFSGNSTGGCGGGIRVSGAFEIPSSPIITNCTFSDNSGSFCGGGIAATNATASPIISGCSFANNEAGSDGGGGVFNSWNSNTQISGSMFCENSPNQIQGRWIDGGANEFSDNCCPADITGPRDVPDGCVDSFDLGAMLGAWCSAVNDPNPPSPPCENCTQANLDLADIGGAPGGQGPPDGCVDSNDLTKLLGDWCSVAGGNPCGTCFP